MKLKRRMALLLATIMVVFGTVCPAFAQTTPALKTAASGKEAANALYELGLIGGAGTDAKGNVDFALNGTTTREEAIVMLVKLLGKGDAAAKAKNACPFTDVADWAKDYVGYAKAAGLANGASETSFNAQAKIQANEFATLLLRALGVANVDYTNPWEAAKEAGLVTKAPAGTFTREGMFAMAYAALGAKDGKLLADAMAEGAVNGSSIAKAINADYKLPTPTLKTLHEDGKKYMFNANMVYFVPGYVRSYLDDYEFILSQAPKAVGNDLYVALYDIAKIYGPDFKVAEKDDKLILTHAKLNVTIQVGSMMATGDNGEFALAAPVIKDAETGAILVPALSLLHYGFAKSTGSLPNQEVWDTSKGGYENGKYDYLKYVRDKNTTIYAVSNTEVQLENNTSAYSNLSVLKNKLRGAKDYGIRYIAFYDEDPRVEECLIAELYVPTCLYFHPEKAVPAVIVFPGAGGLPNAFNSASTADIMQNLQPYAENHGYLLIGIESWTMSAQYGDPTGPIGRFEVTNTDPSHNNPWNKSQLWLDAIETDGDINIHYLEYVESIYNIDKNRVYAYGNSMGAMGAWSMAINYPEYVNAVCGSAGITEIDFWPEDKNVYEHTKAPYLFIGGTEDPNGLDFLLYGSEKLSKALGPDLFQFKLVGGATHGTEWKFNPDLIFQWFDAHPTHVNY